MARCNKCRHRFATLDDEADMHECPHCGWAGHEEPEPDGDDDPDEEAA